MSELRWYDVLNEITKVERKYNIRNPRWDDGWPGVFKDYGFVPIDAKGNWWTKLPDTPELPIIFAPFVTSSATTTGAISGTSATALIDSVSPIVDVTYTEIAGEATATVTTAGTVTATSSAVATGAVGAAIGFGVGVAAFEKAPEFWTQVSNGVFGTDLDPAEIGQMARDTNALVVIKDGIVFMAEDMINSIRDFFFELGAANTGTIEFPTVKPGDNVKVTGFSTVAEVLYTLYPILQDITKATGTDENKERYKSLVGRYGSVEIEDQYSIISGTHTITVSVREGVKYDPDINYTTDKYSTTWTDGGIRTSLYFPGTKSYFAYEKTSSANIIYNSINGTWTLQNCRLDIANTSGRTQPLYFGNNYVLSSNKRTQYRKAFNTNGIVTAGSVPGVTPTGKQGTKDDTLITLFPNWYENAIETVAGDGKTKIKWLPVSPTVDNPLISGNPFTTDEAQEGVLPGNNTETANQLGEETEEQTKTAPSYPTPPLTPDVTPTPSPDTPPLSGAGGSITGLANIYNPTLAQVKQFSRWLWGSDGLNLDQFKKLFQDPMQAIIGLQVIYATPTTGDTKEIQVGYLSSGVSAKIVTEQYIDISCGTVTLSEYFGDARDYAPYTRVYICLPFIGIQELSAEDVVSSKISLQYRVDVLTGTCLALIHVSKYGEDAVLYTFSGSCGVQMPISSGNYLSVIASIIGSVGAGAIKGGFAGAAVGGATSLVGTVTGANKAAVAMSGNLSANAGAMGIRTPYLIVKRAEQADASGYNEFYGYPTNKRVQLSQLTGYVRVKDINLSGIVATEEELAEITRLLKEGVIL